jgi:hypothetical protein
MLAATADDDEDVYSLLPLDAISRLPERRSRLYTSLASLTWQVPDEELNAGERAVRFGGTATIPNRPLQCSAVQCSCSQARENTELVADILPRWEKPTRGWKSGAGIGGRTLVSRKDVVVCIYHRLLAVTRERALVKRKSAEERISLSLSLSLFDIWICIGTCIYKYEQESQQQ